MTTLISTHIVRRTLLTALAAAIALLAACQSIAAPTAMPGTDTGGNQTGARPVLTVASHDSFNASESIVTAFEEEHNVRLQFLTLGDTGEALNKIILSQDAPLADLFFGVDNTFLSRALEANIFQPYESPQLANIPDDLKLDAEYRLLPVDYGFVNINADRHWFDANDHPLPQTLEDLAEPEYAGLLVVQNPATSSPGLAFLLATVAHFGEDGYLDYWQSLRDNDVLITDGWSQAYYEYFTVGSAGAGDRPLVVSYSTSPPADVVFATDGRTEPASVNVSPSEGVFRQIEFIGILQSTTHLALAQAFVDYMLSIPFQEDIPLQMFVYPANREAELPEVFREFASVPAQPADLSPDLIHANRDVWIQSWTDVMLR